MCKTASELNTVFLLRFFFITILTDAVLWILRKSGRQYSLLLYYVRPSLILPLSGVVWGLGWVPEGFEGSITQYQLLWGKFSIVKILKT